MELLRKYLKFSERDFYISYLLHCKKQMSLDLSDCFLKCRPYLDEEMNFINPKIIVALGEDVFLNLYIQNAKNSSFESLRGSFLKFGNAFLMATYSLDKIIKNPSLQANFINDLNKIKDVL
nr:uracil-DNA glycosylase family protein [Campylobacter pinnipediorum]